MNKADEFVYSEADASPAQEHAAPRKVAANSGTKARKTNGIAAKSATKPRTATKRSTAAVAKGSEGPATKRVARAAAKQEEGGTKRRAAIRTTRSAPAAQPAVDHIALRHELIAQRAYFRAEQRGWTPGGELDDWLHAEREVDEALHNRARGIDG